jgi:hypothetical protein
MVDIKFLLVSKTILLFQSGCGISTESFSEFTDA